MILKNITSPAVLKVKRVYDECLCQFETILDPKGLKCVVCCSNPYHIVEQSKLTSIHLLGFVLKDTEYLNPKAVYALRLMHVWMPRIQV